MKKNTNKLMKKIVKIDYNDELENVLTQKKFSKEVKNLLLDILYKIETSYNDYKIVKVNALPLEKYISNIINIVKNDCNNIKFITNENMKNKKGKETIDKEKKEIVCYPIARKLLYSLAEIKKNDNIIKSESSMLNETMTKMINIGNNINTVEPLRDFNGFSWNANPTEIENCYYNLIYQDLIILIGNNFLEEWTNKNNCMVDYLELFKSEIENKYEKKIAKNILEFLKELSILIELKENKTLKKQMQERRGFLEAELKKMNNRKKYLEDMSNMKKTLAKEIKNIDIIINDKKLLEKEFKERNDVLPIEKKILTTKRLSNGLINEKTEMLAQIEECSRLMNPKNYLKKYNDMKKEYDSLALSEIENIDDKILEDVILLQKDILRCIKTKANNAKDKTELMKIIYEIRYFNLIPVNKNQNVSQIDELTRLNLITIKAILKKAHELKLVNTICKDEKTEIQIFSDACLLKIISLENVQFKIYKEEKNTYVQFFDGDLMDEKFKIKMEEKNENNISRGNKNSNRIKLFS